MNPALRRIWGVCYRHLTLFRRSWPRVLELAYWPTLQMMLWGFMNTYLSRYSDAPVFAAGVLLGGVLLWETVLRSQMGFSLSFLEEIWSRNLGHLLVSPLRPQELVAALMVMSLIRTAVGVVPAMVLAWVLYAFDVLTIGPALVGFAAALLMMGWALALGITAMLLRYGAGAEALAWSVVFALMPFAAVFYPVNVLPGWMQVIALATPAAHVFEGMRAALVEQRFAVGHMAAAFVLNAVWIGAAALLFMWQFRRARVRGTLFNIGE